MTAFSRALFSLALFSSSVHAAEHDWPRDPRSNSADQTVFFSLSSRAGLANAPFVTEAFPEVSGFASVLSGEAAFRLSSLGWLRARVPFSIVRLDFPAKAQVSETSLANIELALEHRAPLLPNTHAELLAAIVVPTAEHGPELALLNNRALALANALNAGKDALLLTPGVTGLRLGASIEHTLDRLELKASVGLPVLVRVSEASLPAEARTHSLGLLPWLELRGAFWVTSWFGVSLAGSLIAEPWRVQEPTLESDRTQRVQLMFEPGLQARVGELVVLGLDGIVPTGGRLGGEAFGVALSAGLGF